MTLKKLLIAGAIALASISNVAVAAPNSAFGNVMQGQASNQRYEKPIFLLLYTDTCPHCQNFLKNTMEDPQVKAILGSQFKVEAINVQQNPYVPYDIDFTGTVPSIHLMDSNHIQMANTLTGDIPPQNLVPALQKFIELYNTYRNEVR